MVNQPDWSTDAGFRPDPVSPLGFGPFGERPPIPANDQGSSLARAVSADLEAIFAPVPTDAPEPPRRSARVHTVGGVAKPAASPSRIAGLGAVAAALLAGVVLGSILLKPHPKATPGVAPASAVTVALTPAPRAATPGAADLPAPPPVVAQAPAPKPAAAVARIQPKPAVRHAATSRAAVLAADRRLRRAYADAVRAGVPRGILVAARNRWNATRRAEPARLVAVYGALAADLERRAHGRRR